MVADQVGDAMGERTRLATARTSDHKERADVVIHGPALRMIEAGEKAVGRTQRSRRIDLS